MKTRLCLLVLLLTSITAMIPAHGQGEKRPRTPEDYRPRTLRDLRDLLPDAFAAELQNNNHDKLSVIVHGELFPSRLQVNYAGTTRPLRQMRKSVILSWANQFAGAPEFYTRPFQTEALFTEDGENYWLAVRNDSLPQLERELKKGETVELFVIKMGNVRIDNRFEPVLLVEKIQRKPL